MVAVSDRLVGCRCLCLAIQAEKQNLLAIWSPHASPLHHRQLAKLNPAELAAWGTAMKRPQFGIRLMLLVVALLAIICAWRHAIELKDRTEQEGQRLQSNTYV